MRKLSTFIVVAVLCTAILPVFAIPGPAAAESFADPAFSKVWERTDYLVSLATIERSWYWGPSPFFTAHERYGPNAADNRLVQYFDKSRMEINNPNADPKSQWFVTNGLLVKELVSGQIQISDTAFEARSPADIPVAGDPKESNPAAPTYAALLNVASINNDRPAQNKVGQIVDETIAANGQTSESQNLGLYAGTKLVYFDPNLKHNIPQVFWDFMHSKGAIVVDGQVKNDTLIDWVFTMGYPITEPYWARVRVGGKDRDVMMQAFERRVLTYTPSNTPNWQVEMGNVGQHYYNWRYKTPSVLASVTVSPASAKGGTTFVFNAAGFGADEQINAKLLTPSNTVFGAQWQVKSEADGKAVLYFWSQASHPAGKWELDLQGATTGRTAKVNFTVEAPELAAATVSANPASGPQGTKFQFSAANFTAGETVNVLLTSPDGVSGPLGQYAAGSDGKLTFSFKTYAQSQVGDWSVTAQGSTSGRKATTTFKVTQS
jgi:hypothetical protein